VFKCACGCGGHVLIKRTAAVALDVARDEARQRASEDGEAHCFGSGYFIEHHEPLGMVCRGSRVGKRTHLRATS
jgi:hypothetical protein